MICLLPERAKEIQRFRKNPWFFQQTFKTPSKDLKRFVSTCLEPFSFQAGILSLETVVFEPKNLLSLLTRNSLQADNYRYLAIRAEGQESISTLLEAALGDSVDFAFVAFPKSLAIYADHDEYTTFYTRNLRALKSISGSLEEVGFEPILGYVRGSARDKKR